MTRVEFDISEEMLRQINELKRVMGERQRAVVIRQLLREALDARRECGNGERG